MFDPTRQSRSVEDIKESCGIDDVETIKVLGQKNYEFFFEHIVGYETSSPVTEKAIEFHQDPEEFKETHDDTGAVKAAIMAPRGHSKTVSWTIGPTLWRAWKEQGKEIIISSASRGQSSDILDDIKRIIVRNDMLQHLKPSPENLAELGGNADIENDEKNWAAESITTTTDVTVKTMTFGSSIRGEHVDYVFLDDILQDENSGTRSAEQEKDTFYNVVSPIVENKGGVLQVVGTPMSHDDLLMEIVEKDNLYSEQYQAYYPDDDRVLWPEKWTKDGLMQKKAEVGPARFAREYMCDPMSVEEQYFSINECIEPNLDTTHYKPKMSDDTYSNWEFVLGVDVALSDSDGSDYNVFTVIGDPQDEDERYIVDIVRQQTMSPEAIADQIEQLDRRYGLTKGFYERNAQGEGLKHEIDKRDSIRTRVEPFDTTRTSRPQILSSLQAALYRHELKIVDRENLVSELAAFHKNSRGKLEGKGHDDTVMSLAIAYGCLEGEGWGRASMSIIDEDTSVRDGGVTGIVGLDDDRDGDAGAGQGSDITIGIA